MILRPLLPILLLCSCAAKPAPPPPAPVPLPTSLPGKRVRLAVATPLPPPPAPPPVPSTPAPVLVASPAAAPTVQTLSGADIVAAADQARIDALGYIVWEQSKPENNKRMLALSDALAAAVNKMRASNFDPVDVVEARSALAQLRGFLRTKDD